MPKRHSTQTESSASGKQHAEHVQDLIDGGTVRVPAGSRSGNWAGQNEVELPPSSGAQGCVPWDTMLSRALFLPLDAMTLGVEGAFVLSDNR
jgi:hypothetical protein